MRLEIFVRKSGLGLAPAGLMAMGAAAQIHDRHAGHDVGKDAKEGDKDVKKGTKRGKVHKTHKPRIKTWRDEIQKGPFSSVRIWLLFSRLGNSNGRGRDFRG